MSRYIDEDKVLKIVNDMTECEDDYERITEWVHNMPSIDIVRCKDCRFSEIFQNDSRGVRAMYCRAFTFERMVSEDDYCSYGERRGE